MRESSPANAAPPAGAEKRRRMSIGERAWVELDVAVLFIIPVRRKISRLRPIHADFSLGEDL